MPAMDVPFAAAEAPHFPPLGWQLPAARTAVMAVAGMGHYLQVLPSLSVLLRWLCNQNCMHTCSWYIQ